MAAPPPAQSQPSRVIYTVGHSTRSAEAFASLLAAHGVRAIADVRLIPRSRRHPHFAADALAEWLPRIGVRYLPFPALGGRRRPRADSPNTGWRNESFRGYADYTHTPQFLAAMEALMAAAEERPTATMCAEAVPWRCHRSLISDALLVRGWTVVDLLAESKATPHKLTRFARVEGTTVTYPPEEPELFAGA